MRRVPFVLVSFIGWLASSALAQAAEYIVAEAHSIGYRPGERIESDRPLTLHEGQHLTLITPSGGTINLDGPFRGPPSASSGGVVSILAALTGGGRRYGEVGTTRGTQVNKLPSPWVLDVSHSGKVCVREGAQPVFWRPAASADRKIELVPSDQSWRADMVWPAGKEQLAITIAATLHDGVTYTVTDAGAQAAISVDIIPASISDQQVLAAYLAARGCEEQARAMLGPAG